MKKLFSLALLILLVGCVAVPKTTVNFRTGKFSSPKDDALQGLKVDYYSTPDGTVHTVTSIDSANGKNNPDVINSAAAGQVQVINAYAAAIQQAIQTGMQIAAAAYGIPLPSVPTPTSGTISNTSPIIPSAQ